jgi:ppGpp synthetase/RelA/SpoT-type nucleotidyltranferase
MKINKNLIEEYKSKQSVYDNFAKTVESILKTLLEINEFRYQNVYSRGKEIISLRRKINEHEKFQKIETVTEIDDLAGCRVIFYLDNDIERFRNYIYKEFKVVKDNLRYSEEDYNARHIIVKLCESRLALSEYAKFSGMKCEIQLTTVLYHAWSEMNHDIIYKPQGLSDFDEKSFELLKEQLPM